VFIVAAVYIFMNQSGNFQIQKHIVRGCTFNKKSNVQEVNSVARMWKLH